MDLVEENGGMAICCSLCVQRPAFAARLGLPAHTLAVPFVLEPHPRHPQRPPILFFRCRHACISSRKWQRHAAFGSDARDPHSRSRRGRLAPCNQKVCISQCYSYISGNDVLKFLYRTMADHLRKFESLYGRCSSLIRMTIHDIGRI